MADRRENEDEHSEGERGESERSGDSNGASDDAVSNEPSATADDGSTEDRDSGAPDDAGELDTADDATDGDVPDETDDGESEWATEEPTSGGTGGSIESHGVPGGEPAAAGGGGAAPATAPDDQEMPLTEHVEEMALRFMAVGLVVAGVGAITLFYADELINFLWYSFLGPGLDTCPGPECPESVAPRIYHPLALVLARLKVASLVGLLAALPVAVYQTYRFMRPGLYPRERRYYLAAVPTSLVLAAVGVSFAYFAILPAMFSYFTSYSERAAEIAFGLTETFNLIVLMIGFFALVFQIPLLVMLAIMMGVTTRRWLENRRLYFWGGFGAVAFLFSPDPTGMAPLMVAVTMIVLFEGTLLLLRWTASDSPLFSPEAFASRRPYAWGLAVLVGYVASAAPVPGSYYDRFPAIVRETLVYNELVAMTPIITGVGLIVLFELVAYLVRRLSPDPRAGRPFARVRFPVWMASLAAGYLASPNPPLLDAVSELALPTTQALLVVAGLIVAFELLVVGLRWRKNRAT